MPRIQKVSSVVKNIILKIRRTCIMFATNTDPRNEINKKKIKKNTFTNFLPMYSIILLAVIFLFVVVESRDDYYTPGRRCVAFEFLP